MAFVHGGRGLPWRVTIADEMEVVHLAAERVTKAGHRPVAAREDDRVDLGEPTLLTGVQMLEDQRSDTAPRARRVIVGVTPAGAVGFGKIRERGDVTEPVGEPEMADGDGGKGERKRRRHPTMVARGTLLDNPRHPALTGQVARLTTPATEG